MRYLLLLDRKEWQTNGKYGATERKIQVYRPRLPSADNLQV